MESPPKNQSKKYEKKSHPFVTLNVPNYLASVSANSAKNNSNRYLLIKYLASHRNAEFFNYSDIANALRQEYHLPADKLSKSAISKVVTSIQGDLNFEDGTYYFAKVDSIYKLRKRFSTANPLLTELYSMKSTFLRDSVHFIGQDTAVFSVNPKYTSTVKEKFYTILGSSTCFGIMEHDEYLLIMLNSHSPEISAARTMLKEFFRQKKNYEAKLEARKRQDAEIRANRKKA